MDVPGSVNDGWVKTFWKVPMRIFFAFLKRNTKLAKRFCIVRLWSVEGWVKHALPFLV